jgi:hypothetical protein
MRSDSLMLFSLDGSLAEGAGGWCADIRFKARRRGENVKDLYGAMMEALEAGTDCQQPALSQR